MIASIWRCATPVSDRCIAFVQYQITGIDGLRFLNRLVTRDVGKCPIGGMLYTPWCNSRAR